MTDARHNDVNTQIRATIDDALADLLLFGFASADQAAALMAIQSITRIDDDSVIKQVADFANEIRSDEKRRGPCQSRWRRGSGADRAQNSRIHSSDFDPAPGQPQSLQLRTSGATGITNFNANPAFRPRAQHASCARARARPNLIGADHD